MAFLCRLATQLWVCALCVASLRGGEVAEARWSQLPASKQPAVGAAPKTALPTKPKRTSIDATHAGLTWLKAHQSADGSWSEEYRPAMTGLAVISLIGDGWLPGTPEFAESCAKGVDWLLAEGAKHDGRMSMTKDGWGAKTGAYEHAIGTYAICLYYINSGDKRVIELIKKAVGYIVAGQAADGGWQYDYRKDGNSDISLGSWQIQALIAAEMSELEIAGVEQALDKAMLNLKRVRGERGGFGYNLPADDYHLAGAGLYSTYLWTRTKDDALKAGYEFLIEQAETKYPVKYSDDNASLYTWYYNTVACLAYGGMVWNRWNRLYLDEICGHQNADGSWPPIGRGGGLEAKADGAGPFYRTSLGVLMTSLLCNRTQIWYHPGGKSHTPP